MLLTIEPHSNKTIQRQIADQLRQMISDGSLTAGTRVPSTRALGEQLKVARNTVVLAYDRLIAEGFLEIGSSRATYVCKFIPQQYVSVDSAKKSIRPRRNLLDDSITQEMDLKIHSKAEGTLAFDFKMGPSDGSLLPASTWRRLLAECFGGMERALEMYSDPAGYLPLRRALSTHLKTARGVTANKSS